MNSALLIWFYILQILLFQGSHALDVSWIPSDPDGPLPLSSNYRASLQKLCVLLKGNGKLPPELIAKKASLEKMCRQLQQGEDLIRSNPFHGFGLNNPLTLGIGLTLCGGAALWMYRHELLIALRRLLQRNHITFGGKGYSLSANGKREIRNDASSLEEVRALRLKKFLASDELLDVGKDD